MTATVININAEQNPEVMQACESLAGYSRLLQLIREYHRDTELADAVDAAVDQCIKERLLVDYLRARRAEVREMYLMGFDEAEERRRLKNEIRIAKEEAAAEGLAEGLAEGHASERSAWLKNAAGLVRDGILSIEEAAHRFDLTDEEAKALV